MIGLIALMWLLLTQVAIWTMPTTARLDRDEGYNLIKASLVSRGYQLYSDVWSDQPPLFTYMMAATDRWVGSLDDADRALISIHSTILISAVGYVAMRLGGYASAGVLAVLLTLSGRQMGKLSMAVMIGLPAVAWAMVAVALVLYGTGRRRSWIAMSTAGAIFAGAVLIKMFALILLPFAVAACIWAVRRKPPEYQTSVVRALVPALFMFLGTFTVVLWGFGPWREPSWQAQLVDVHTAKLHGHNALRSIAARLGEDTPLLVAAIALLLMGGRDAWSRCWPAWVWFATSLLALSKANPVWGHHRIMLVVPLAISAGVCSVRLLERLSVRPWQLPIPRPAATVAAVALVVALVSGVVQRSIDLTVSGRTGSEQLDPDVLAELRRFAAPDDILMTDDPHFAIAAGLLVPPDLAVWSYKRQEQGQVTRDLLLKIRDRDRPRAILLTRKPLPHGWEDKLTEGYELALRKAHRRLYRRVDEPEVPQESTPLWTELLLGPQFDTW